MVTAKVKSQIRRFFRSKKRDEYILFGKEILSSFFIKENYMINIIQYILIPKKCILIVTINPPNQKTTKIIKKIIP